VECNLIYILDAGRCLHSILRLVQLETTGFCKLVSIVHIGREQARSNSGVPKEPHAHKVRNKF